MSQQKSFYGWKLVGAVWLIYFLNMGFAFYGGTVINPVMMKEIPMSRAMYGMAFTLLNFFVGFPSLLQAFTVNKWGIKTTFVIGSSLIAAGCLWMSYVCYEPWQYLVGFGVIIGTGLGFGTIIGLSTAITRWFVRFRGRAMAIAYTASGFGGFIAAPLLSKVIAANNGNWRIAWLVVCGLAITAALTAMVFVKERPEDYDQVPDGSIAPPEAQGAKKTLATSYDWTPSEAYRTSSFWMVFIGSCACQFPLWLFAAHWIPHLKGLGVEPTLYAFAMGLFTMGSIVGRLIGGWCMDKISARYAFMLGLVLFCFGSVMAIVVTKENMLLIYAAGILYGGAFGWAWVCLNTTTGHFFGIKAFPKLNGTILMLSAALCSPAAIIGGKLFDVYQSYTPAFLLNMAIAVVGILALWFARMPVPRTVENSGVKDARVTA
jgi:MFS family permease